MIKSILNKIKNIFCYNTEDRVFKAGKIYYGEYNRFEFGMIEVITRDGDKIKYYDMYNDVIDEAKIYNEKEVGEYVIIMRNNKQKYYYAKDNKGWTGIYIG